MKPKTWLPPHGRSLAGVRTPCPDRVGDSRTHLRRSFDTLGRVLSHWDKGLGVPVHVPKERIVKVGARWFTFVYVTWRSLNFT